MAVFPCTLPGAEWYIPGCQGPLAQQANQATGGFLGNLIGGLTNPATLGQETATALGAGTNSPAQSTANSLLNAFAQVTGAKSFVDLEQRSVLIGAGIFFIFLGFIVLFFAHGGAETVVNLASPSESEAGEAGAGESNAAKLGEAAEVGA